MPTLDDCINSIFEPGNIGSSSGSTPTTVIGGTAAPIILSDATGSVLEESQLAFGLVANKAVTWTIVSGDDQAQFAISGATLTWVADGVQDHEAPLDADTDNVYLVTIQASDFFSRTTTQDISITVTNIPDVGTPVGLLLALTVAV